MNNAAQEITTIEQAMPAVTAPVSETTAIISMIERVAMTPTLPIERLSALMDMRERQMNKEAEQIFNQAFAAAMAEMPDVKRSGKNTHSGQTYSMLDDLIHAARPVLSRHGLSLNWQTANEGNRFTVTAIVRHSQGHSIQTSLSGERDTGKQMNALQGGGSTETYLKRYTGFSILGLSSGDEKDDDGQGSGDFQTITEDQVMQIRDLLEANSKDEKRFLAYIKLATLADIRADKLDDAVALIKGASK